MYLYMSMYTHINVFHGLDENGSTHVTHPSIHPSSFTQQTFIKPLLCAKSCAKLYCTIENTIYSVLDLFTS